MRTRRRKEVQTQADRLIDQYDASAHEVARALRRQHVADFGQHQFWSAVVREIQLRTGLRRSSQKVPILAGDEVMNGKRGG